MKAFPSVWQIRHGQLDCSQPLVVGVLNITPDSFSDGGRYLDPKLAWERAITIQQEGADILEIGAESTRPGADAVSPEEEWRRLAPVLSKLCDIKIPISLDTRHAQTLERALDFPIQIVNDVTCARNTRLVEVAATAGCGYVLMHSRGSPDTMMQEAQYDDVVENVFSELDSARQSLSDQGITATRMCLDPGLGFAKLPEHNWRILRELEKFGALGLPLMIGISRKRTLRELVGNDSEALAAAGLAVALLAVQKGARLIRTHDVGITVAGLKTFQTISVKLDTKGL